MLTCIALETKQQCVSGLETTHWSPIRFPGFLQRDLVPVQLNLLVSLDILFFCVAMEAELQGLKGLVEQLTADNSLLRQGQGDVPPGSMISSNVSVPLPSVTPLEGANTVAPERLIFVPQGRKCSYFSGRSGVKINEWVEEAQAGMRRAHCLTAIDQAFFLFDHLEGEAREEIKYRPAAEREDPNKIIGILKDLYGCSQSYVALQEAFFSRRQQDGETLQEFSLALMGLMEKVKQHTPAGRFNADAVMRDQFIEHVLDKELRWELKRLLRSRPTMTLLEVREEAVHWERAGRSEGVRHPNYSIPPTLGVQYAEHGSGDLPRCLELSELTEMLKQQQEQLNQLMQVMAPLSDTHRHHHLTQTGPVICRRCQQPGHLARKCNGRQARTYPAQLELPTGPLIRVTQAAVTALPGYSSSDLRSLQSADVVIQEVLGYWRRKARPSAIDYSRMSKAALTLLGQMDRFVETDGIVYRKVFHSKGAEKSRQLILPTALRDQVLTQLYQEHGHQGVERTTELVRQHYYWPGMASDVSRWCSDTDRHEVASQLGAPRFRGSLTASQPNEIVVVDFTRLKHSRTGLENVLVITDVFSKYTLAIPTRDQRASTVAQVLVKEWFYKLGVPENIYLSQGQHLEVSLFQQLCSLYGVKNAHSTRYHPAGNGQGKHFNPTLHNLLHTLPTSRRRDWVDCLPQMLFCYNTTPHQATGEAPHYLLFGQVPRPPVDFLLGKVTGPAPSSVKGWVIEHQIRLRMAFEGARELLKLAASCQVHRDRRVVRALKPGRAEYTCAPVGEQSQVRQVHGIITTRQSRGEALVSTSLSNKQATSSGSEDFHDGDLFVLTSESDYTTVEPAPEECPTRQVLCLGPSVLQLDEPPSNRESDQQVSPECGEFSPSEAVPVTLVASEISAVVLVDSYTLGQRDQPSTSSVESDPLLPLPRSPDLHSERRRASRRNVRPTAGHHSNPYHLPQSVAGEPIYSPSLASNAVSALYRPWNQGVGTILGSHRRDDDAISGGGL